MENNKEKIINSIVSGVDKSWNKDEIIRYVYITLGKLINKNVFFFYSLGEKLEEKTLSFEEIKELYESTDIDPLGMVCKTCTVILKEILDKLGIESKQVQTVTYNRFNDKNSDKYVDIYHWLLSVKGEKNREYFLTLIPDLFNIQYGMRTKHFANKIDYMRESSDGEFKQVYLGDKIDNYAMNDKEIEELDKKIGYVHPYYEEENGKMIEKADYNDLFISQLREFVLRKGEYLKFLSEETDFYKKIKSFEIKYCFTVDEYLNCFKEDVKLEDLEPWFNYILELSKEKYSEGSKEYNDIANKVEALKKVIMDRKGNKYRTLLQKISQYFINKDFLINDDETYSNEYVSHKFETLFPLMFGCNDDVLKPITATFNGLAEQLDFIDLFMDNMFAELKDAKVNKDVELDPKLSLIRNRIDRYIVLDADTDKFKILFNVNGNNKNYLFDPYVGTFQKQKNVLDVLSSNYTIVSSKLKDKMKIIEDIEEDKIR